MAKRNLPPFQGIAQCGCCAEWHDIPTMRAVRLVGLDEDKVYVCAWCASPDSGCRMRANGLPYPGQH